MDNPFEAMRKAYEEAEKVDKLGPEEYLKVYLDQSKAHRDLHLEKAARADSIVKLVEANQEVFKEFLYLIKEL